MSVIVLLIGLLGCAPQAVARPDVVLVIGCTLRADQLGPWGGDGQATPFLNAAARRGTRFEWTIAQGMWTRTGSAAIVLGKHPYRLGLPEPKDGRNDRRLPEEAVLLSERFAAAGYHTIGSTGNSNLNPVFGFAQGFADYQGTERLWRDGQKKVEGLALVEHALARVDAAPADRPLFLQVLLLDAHQPVTVGETEVAQLRRPGTPERVAAYRAMVRRFDGALEALVDGLAERGHDASNTLFVVVGDHGEGLGFPAHHGPGHGNFLYPSVAHVPWLMWGPGVPRWGLVEGVSAQIDVAPTVLGLAGLGGDPTFDGLDLSERVRRREDVPVRQVYTETWFQEAERAAFYTADRLCQRDYRGQGLPEGCCDLRADPTCARPQPDPILDELDAAHRAAAAELAGFGEGVPMDVDPALSKQLEALGYR